MISDLFAGLLFLSLLCLVVGLIKPSIFNFLKLQITRKKSATIFGGLILIFFILFGITSETPDTKKQQNANNIALHNQNTSAPIATCQTSNKEISPKPTANYPDRKYYEEIYCGDGKATTFRLTRQLTDVSIYNNDKLQLMCSGTDCDGHYDPYDPNNVVVIFKNAPQINTSIKITGAQALASEMQKPKPLALNKVIFDIPAIAAKITYPNIKSLLGKPTRESLPDNIYGTDGLSEWDKDGFTLSLGYNKAGLLKNNSLSCAISLFPKKGENLNESQLRLAGNLDQEKDSFIVEDKFTGLMLTFTIQPSRDINGKLYGIEVCP